MGAWTTRDKDANNESGASDLLWSRRLKIFGGVVTTLKYLHEEWEYRVIHRDVKSSNLMLYDGFNARLGDFGSARMSKHNEISQGIVLAGTRGYLAPKYVQTLQANEKTDVYSFGALVLEVATGKKSSLWDEDKGTCELLVDMVWGLYGRDALLEAADGRLQNAYHQGEMLTLLKIGLLCSHRNPADRPTMREVIDIGRGLRSLPKLSRVKPFPKWTELDFDEHGETAVMIHLDDFGQSHLRSDQTFTGDSDAGSNGHRTNTMPSRDENNSLQRERLVGKNGSSGHSPKLRRLQLSPGHTSLPF